jgi:predicted acetyltransferase
MIRLVTPASAYRHSFLEGATEFFAEGRPESTYAPSLGYDSLGLRQRFGQFAADLVALEAGRGGDRHSYVDRVLWLVDDGRYVGQASVRPELTTDFLMTYGGHIGYSIRPTQRRQGYGVRILALALPVAREMGLERILVTCNADNAASRSIIERNGGRLERALSMPREILLMERLDPDKPLDKLRFWIDLSDVIHPT